VKKCSLTENIGSVSDTFNFQEKFKGEILKNQLWTTKALISSAVQLKHGKDERFECRCSQMARKDGSQNMGKSLFLIVP
jgi:hypothetical protein